ncbi:MAG: hypothetical protein HZA35_04215 [Parcubacteria group bacterium]|nr:hypothetical protein [Parcubacteria group bacterium]
MKKHAIEHVDSLTKKNIDEVMKLVIHRIHNNREFQRSLSLFRTYIKKHLATSIHLFLRIYLDPEENEETQSVSYTLRWYMFLKLKNKEGINQTPLIEDFQNVIPRYFKEQFNIIYESP